MKKHSYLILILFLIVVTSCTVQSKIGRGSIGKDKVYLDELFEQTGVITELKGRPVLMYNKSKILRSIPVNKGVTTLDPMISPVVEKKEIYYFFLDDRGNVTDYKYEKEYSR